MASKEKVKFKKGDVLQSVATLRHAVILSSFYNIPNRSFHYSLFFIISGSMGCPIVQFADKSYKKIGTVNIEWLSLFYPDYNWKNL